MNSFFEYIFYRSYIDLYKTRYKYNAEARSIALVTFIQFILVFSVIVLFSKFTNIYFYHSVGRNKLLLFTAPIVLIVWWLNERHYKRLSKNDYWELRKRFDKNKYNKIIPFWLIFIFPFVLMFGVPFILSLFK